MTPSPGDKWGPVLAPGRQDKDKDRTSSSAVDVLGPFRNTKWHALEPCGFFRVWLCSCFCWGELGDNTGSLVFHVVACAMEEPTPAHPIPPHPCPSLPCPAFRALLVRRDASDYEHTLCSLKDGTDMESVTILLQVKKGPFFCAPCISSAACQPPPAPRHFVDANSLRDSWFHGSS